MRRFGFSTFMTVTVTTALLLLPAGSAPAQALLEWSQINTGGFGDIDNFSAFSIAVYNGHVYVGTGNLDDRCQVWRFDGPNPDDWTKVSEDGFGNGLRIVTDLVVYNGRLFASTFKPASQGPGEVWRYDGSNWTRVGQPGLGDPTLYAIWDLQEFDGQLWAGCSSSATGAAVYAWDGSSWEEKSTDGFGNEFNADVRAMTVHNGMLYAGTYNDTQGGEVWRFVGPNRTDWEQIASGGFGEFENIDARSLASFQGQLIIGTANPSTGLQVFAWDGNDLDRIDPGTFQYDSGRCMAVASGSTLYLGTGNDQGFPFGTQVWKFDGGEWTQVNDGGFGDDDNIATHALHVSGNMLYATTVNDVTGGNVYAAEIDGAGELMYRSFIPAGANAGGAAGSFFVTDADFNNTSADMTVQFRGAFLARGQDNSDPIHSDVHSLAPGQSMRVENILESEFGLQPDAVGAVLFEASSPDFIGMSRTFNQPSAKVSGTFGQALPVVPEDDFIPAGETRRIIFMSENEDFRANVGCVNATLSDIEILIDLYDAEGTALETKTMDLGPRSNNQLNRIFRAYLPVNGYVDVRSETPGALFYCYGSVLDNVTSDPTSILPQVPSSGQRYYVPAAALAAGAAGAFFQTDVDVNNSGADSSYVFMWLPRGEDNSMPVQSDSMSLSAGNSVRYENVLAEVFDAEPDVVGALGMQSQSQDFLSMSRTYNVPGSKIAGTFGQALPGIQEGDMIGPNDRRRIVFLSENGDFRANVGCASGAGVETEIMIELFNADGDSLEVKTLDLAPWSNDQINRVFRGYQPVDGYVDVWSETPGALFYCYGSLLDNDTSDPTTILPQQ